jgi:hypothetical protein
MFIFHDLGEQIGKFVEERLGLEPVVVKESDLDEY